MTVLFAGMKGSTELLADRDPEEAIGLGVLAEIAVCSEPLDAQSAQQHYASAPSPGRRTRRRSPQASETSPEKRLSMAAGE